MTEAPDYINNLFPEHVNHIDDTGCAYVKLDGFINDGSIQVQIVSHDNGITDEQYERAKEIGLGVELSYNEWIDGVLDQEYGQMVVSPAVLHYTKMVEYIVAHRGLSLANLNPDFNALAETYGEDVAHQIIQEFQLMKERQLRDEGETTKESL